MQVYLLGQFQVSYQGENITSISHARLQELLAYLLLQNGKPVSRQQIAYLFWPESNDEQARTNLRNLIHRLKKAFPAIHQFLLGDENQVQWNSATLLTLDVADFESALRRAEVAGKPDRVEILTQAVSLYGGDLLPECFSDWLLSERERLRQLYLAGVMKLAELHEEQRNYPRAIQSIQDLLRLDSLNENAYAWLMRLYALEGNRGQALHVYHLCAEALRRELDVEPGPVLRSHYKKLLQTDALQIPSAPIAMLITRQAEWEQLTRNWNDMLHENQPLRTVLISGECGIGKTHLAQSFVNWVQRQGYRTSGAACYESGSDLAYAPISAWLAGLYEQDLRSFDKLSPLCRLEISRLLPELRTRDANLGLPGSLSEKWQLLRFYEALLQCFAALQGQGLLLFLDDMHWCDPETLALLAYLQTKPVLEKLMLIATARSEAIAETLPAMQVFRKTSPNKILELHPLDQAETRMLVEQLLNAPAEAVQVQSIFAQSEGNPLFVTEIVRSGLDNFLDSASPLPERIQAVIDWRLDRLSASARQVLDLAAVIGRSFSYELLRASSRLDEQNLVNALDECWRQRILREKNNQDYDFSHDKLRQVVYTGLSQTRRRMWHEQVARALEHIFSGNPDQVAEQIARHFELAGQTGRAVLFYERAAEASQRLYALPQAAVLWEKALSLLETEATSQRQAPRLYEQLGHTLLIGGRYEVARKNLSRALEWLHPDEALGRARVLRQVAQSWSAQLRYDEASAALNHALIELDSLPLVGIEREWMQEWLEIRLQQVDHFYFKNQPDEMQNICDLLSEALLRFGTPKQEAEYCSLLGMLNNRRQRYRVSPETVWIVSRGLELAKQIGDPLLISRKHFGLGFNLLWYGDRAAAIDQLDQALEQAERLGATFCQNQALAYLAIAHRMNGDRTMVNQLAQRGLALAKAEQHPTCQGTALANLAWLAYHQGDLEQADQLGQNALMLWQNEKNYPLEWLADFPLAAVALQRRNIPLAQEYLAAMLRPPQQRLPEMLETSLFAATSAASPGKPIRQSINTASQMGYL